MNVPTMSAVGSQGYGSVSGTPRNKAAQQAVTNAPSLGLGSGATSAALVFLSSSNDSNFTNGSQDGERANELCSDTCGSDTSPQRYSDEHLCTMSVNSGSELSEQSTGSRRLDQDSFV